jgi:tRNA A37 threonylcarbamoyladenosine synthetase subunit TsaC/SUA5/YrdC
MVAAQYFSASEATAFRLSKLPAENGDLFDMNNVDLAIATITLARTESEEKALRAALTQLASFQLPVFVTDGGSSPTFLNFMRSLPQVIVQTAKGLWPQAKNSITAASRLGTKYILYTEPDKLIFFANHLPTMLASSTIMESTGVVLASRSANGFATFPSFQQITETAINRCCQEVIGKEMDYCYGPFIFNRQLLPYLQTMPDTIGWGWRPFVFATAHRLGLEVAAFEADFVCPPDQQSDNAVERIYRMKQLAQNIDGLVLATSSSLP